MRVLITRHESAAGKLAVDLQTRGYEPVIEPQLEIVDTGVEIDLAGVQAVLASSANGIAALSRRIGSGNMPGKIRVLTVGDATAEAARDCGFTDVESAAGDASSLAALASARCDPAAGRLLHVAGGHIAGNMADQLERAGFTVDRAVLYEARTPAALGKDTARRISAGDIDAVLFYSSRTAETFFRLADEAGLRDACAAMSAVCLSAAVAEAAKKIDWRRVRVAASPDGAAMVTALDALRDETLQTGNGADER